MASSHAIEAVGLTKRYGSKTALDRFDLDVARGSVCSLLGPNGAGKTTAVRLLTTLAEPDEGSATVGPSSAAPRRCPHRAAGARAGAQGWRRSAPARASPHPAPVPA